MTINLQFSSSVHSQPTKKPTKNNEKQFRHGPAWYTVVRVTIFILETEGCMNG